MKNLFYKATNANWLTGKSTDTQYWFRFSIKDHTEYKEVLNG